MTCYGLTSIVGHGRVANATVKDGTVVSVELQEAIADYFNAPSREEQHRAYVRYLRCGGPPAYGESEAEVEKIKGCADCEADVPLSERGFGQ